MTPLFMDKIFGYFVLSPLCPKKAVILKQQILEPVFLWENLSLFSSLRIEDKIGN